MYTKTMQIETIDAAEIEEAGQKASSILTPTHRLHGVKVLTTLVSAFEGGRGGVSGPRSGIFQKGK